MLMPASSEFVALCQSQIALLTQGLGATLSVVYLTEELVEGSQAKLKPVVAYPETAGVWGLNQGSFLFPAGQPSGLTPRLPSADRPGSLVFDSISENSSDSTEVANEGETTVSPLWRQRQIVLPLMHEGVVMGLLVTSREDRPWNDRERANIERIATTLALACMMDQRSHWFEQQLSQQRRLQAEQEDIFDDLLHQFRNPLTALRVFGKLLLKRFLPGDTNREVASSIVRESERLQELLQQFDQAIDITEPDLSPSKMLSAIPVSSAEADPQPPSILPPRALPLESCSVAEILEPLLVSSRVIAQDRNLECHTAILPNLPPVQAHAKALREVLSNLLDNALKYTPAGGQIYIQVGLERQSSQGTYQGIAISDTGPGIPLQDREHLFERHYRGVQESTAIAGSGLGLAIARDLVEQMQGEIEVISPAEISWATEGASDTPERNPSVSAPTLGPGTTFIVWLPVSS